MTWNDEDVIAILSSDWHVTSRCPPARLPEPDWWEAMARPVRELVALRNQHRCPLVIAGDLFHRWNEPPETVNWLMKELRSSWDDDAWGSVYAIAGQHDLPHHRMEDVKKSCFWTLVESNHVTFLEKGKTLAWDGMEVRGFSWGEKVEPVEKPSSTFGINLAVIHAFAWINEKPFPDASDESRLKNWSDRLINHDAVVFGDNHQGWSRLKRKPQIINPGSLMRRHSDQIDHRPCCGLLRRDGSIEVHHLDCSQDKFIDVEVIKEKVGRNVELDDFFEEMSKKGEGGIDFELAVKRRIESLEISKGARRVVIECVEEAVRK